jgi:hypothetical protein
MASITCKSCGAELSEDSKFCGTCGTPVEPNTVTDPPNEAILTEPPIASEKVDTPAATETPPASQIKPGGIKGVNISVNGIKKLIVPNGYALD